LSPRPALSSSSLDQDMLLLLKSSVPDLAPLWRIWEKMLRVVTHPSGCTAQPEEWGTRNG
jgi:hypothetical protein